MVSTLYNIWLLAALARPVTMIFLSNSGWEDALNDISETIFRRYYGNYKKSRMQIDIDEAYINKINWSKRK